jgi:hypothetical protein
MPKPMRRDECWPNRTWNRMTESQLKHDLRAVRALFSGPSKWTKNTYARDEWGGRSRVRDECSVSWCLTGAVVKVSDVPSPCLYEIFRYIPGRFASVASWQDRPERTFEDVLQLLDRVIEGTA